MAEYRSRTGINEETIVSSDGRQVHVRRTQDCEPMFDAIAAARELPRAAHMRHVGSIPLVLWAEWMREAGITPGQPDTMKKMNEVVKRKLLSNEFQRLAVHKF